MKRVRPLHRKSCLELLEVRSNALPAVMKEGSVASQECPLVTFNHTVRDLISKHGKEWCLEHGIVEFPEEDFRFSVIMPVFNEANTIEEMIDRVCQVDLPLQLVVVDDGSTDGTSETLRKLNGSGELDKANGFGSIDVKLLFHKNNQGKGAALKTGFLAASGDVVGIQDADREYDPQEFIILLSTILADQADVVYGSRFATTNSNQDKQGTSPGWHRWGNGLITSLSNLKTGLNVTDAETCYKVIRKSVLDQFVDGLIEKRFGIELEMTAKIAKLNGVRFDERPISYKKRTYAEGKKIGIKDGFRAMWCIMKY